MIYNNTITAIQKSVKDNKYVEFNQFVKNKIIISKKNFPDTIIFIKYFKNILPYDIILKIFEFYSNKEIKDLNLRDIKLESLLECKGDKLLSNNEKRELKLVISVFNIFEFKYFTGYKEKKTVSSIVLLEILSLLKNYKYYNELSNLPKYIKNISIYIENINKYVLKLKNLMKNKNIKLLIKEYHNYNNILEKYLDYREKILLYYSDYKYKKKITLIILPGLISLFFKDIEYFTQLISLEKHKIKIFNKYLINFKNLLENKNLNENINILVLKKEVNNYNNFLKDFLKHRKNLSFYNKIKYNNKEIIKILQFKN